MATYTIELHDEHQYQQLLQLAEALGIASPVPASLTEDERQHHLRIIAQGGSGQSIPDPMARQREIRADRSLPGRD